MKLIFWVMGFLAVIYFMSAFTHSSRGIDGSALHDDPAATYL